jgi:class 3 adenylate cyclase/HAMP domain-containing protein
VVATVAALFLARRMVRPIRALQQGAVRVGAGELDQRIDIRTGDEFEDLAATFNRMAGQLRDSYATLERKVEERTQELAQTVAELRLVNETVQEQAKQLQHQTAQLAEWNRNLEQRVADQVGEIERVSRLKRFLSPQLADLVVTSGDERMLESHRRDVAIVFCDLRGFTALAETAEPEEVMEVLGQYHAALGEIIHRFEGTLERFLGDGLMVLFNDPIPCADPADRAVKMAVAMRDCVAGLAQGWRRRGRELGFGVGIAQGYATLGRIGFEGRFDYAAIGTVANLASRLCAEARSGQILISQRVMTAVEDLVDAETLGEVPLKGLAQPIAIYNIRGLKGGL